MFGKMSSFAVLRCFGAERVTLIAHRQGTEPVWNQEFIMKKIPNVLDTLDVEVFSRKTLKEESLGSAIVPLKNAMNGTKVEETCDLYDDTGKKKTGGQIRLSIYFEDPERKKEEDAQESAPKEEAAPVQQSESKPAEPVEQPQVEEETSAPAEVANETIRAAPQAKENVPEPQQEPVASAPPPVFFPDPDDYVPPEPPASSYVPPQAYSQPAAQPAAPFGGHAGYGQPAYQQGFGQAFQPIPQSNFAGNRRQRAPRNMFAGARFAGNRRRRHGNYYYHFGNRPRGSRNNNNFALFALFAALAACFCRPSTRQV